MRAGAHRMVLVPERYYGALEHSDFASTRISQRCAPSEFQPRIPCHSQTKLTPSPLPLDSPGTPEPWALRYTSRYRLEP